MSKFLFFSVICLRSSAVKYILNDRQLCWCTHSRRASEWIDHDDVGNHNKPTTSSFHCRTSCFQLSLDLTWYSALPISHGHFSPNNSRKTPMARPFGRDMGVFRELKIWPKFRIRSCCTVCNIVLYCTVIYRESIIMWAIPLTILHDKSRWWSRNLWRRMYSAMALRWRHNERDGVSNHQPHDCLLNRLFRCRSKKTSKLRVTGLCEANLPVTGEFPAQKASNAENISVWWRHHEVPTYLQVHWSPRLARIYLTKMAAIAHFIELKSL